MADVGDLAPRVFTAHAAHPRARNRDAVLRACGRSVTGVETDELGPNVLATRIGAAGPAGTQEVTAPSGSAPARGAALRGQQ